MTNGAGISRVQVGLEPRACEICAKEFRPYRAWVVTCSRSCRDKRGPRNDAPHARTVTYSCVECGATASTVSTVGAGVFKYCPGCKAVADARMKDRKNAARLVAANPRRRSMNLRGNLRRYGMTIAEYEALLAAQGGVCAICGDEPDPNGVRAASRLHVDHCHTSGANRALLCSRCNAGLGYFRDRPALLESAAEYLRAHLVGGAAD